MSILHENDFYEAVRSGNVDLVSGAIAAGQDIHANFGRALKLAAINGHALMAQILLDAGALPDASSAEGGNGINAETALSFACECGREDVVVVLLSAGADVNFGGGMAMVRAAEWGHLALVDHLVVAGADLQNHGEAALRAAMQMERRDMIRRLIELGAPPSFLLPGTDGTLSDWLKCATGGFRSKTAHLAAMTVLKMSGPKACFEAAKHSGEVVFLLRNRLVDMEFAISQITKAPKEIRTAIVSEL